MPRLNAEQRHRALGQLDAGRTVRAVAAAFGCSNKTIKNLRARVRQTGSVSDRPRSGRPRVTTARQDRVIRITHLRDRFRPASRTARETPGRHNPRVSAPTVRRRLREAGLKARKPYTGSVLTDRHRRQRLNWARLHRRWNQREWNNILFTDESRFQLDMKDGRVKCWRRPNVRFTDACVAEHDRWGGPGVMVWGGISARGRTGIVNFNVRNGRGNGVTARRYIDTVLRPVVVPFLIANPGMTLMHDNARPHTARITADFLQQHNVNVLPWPSLSPDFNPIEHFWDQMGQDVNKRQVRPRNANQLWQSLQNAWQNIPHVRITRLINSMRRRCTACIAANGGHTRY